jgi:hypothetical protein
MIKIKTILAAASLAAFSYSASAQSFGFKTGINISGVNEKFDGKKNDDNKNRMGLNFGLVAEIPLSDLLAVETGLILNQKGFKYEWDEGFYDDDDEFSSTIGSLIKVRERFNYLELPINARLNLEMGKKSAFYLSAGPYFAFMMSGKSRVGVADAVKYDSEVWKYTNRLDIGLNFGAGFALGIVDLGVGYGLGLTNLAKDAEKYSMKNKAFNISMAMKFGRNK